jgi:hypothetical protein
MIRRQEADRGGARGGLAANCGAPASPTSGCWRRWSACPRPLFVPATFGEHAWDNVALPIGQGQTISQPLVVALMTAALELGRPA